MTMSGEKNKRAVAAALKYNSEDGGVPKVVASGSGFVAEKILDAAFESGVKVRQDADLAQMLAAVDIGSDIPVEAFAAVAEILSYIYQTNAQIEDAPV